MFSLTSEPIHIRTEKLLKNKEEKIKEMADREAYRKMEILVKTEFEKNMKDEVEKIAKKLVRVTQEEKAKHQISKKDGKLTG